MPAGGDKEMKVNTSYWYEERDIHKLLKLKIKTLQTEDGALVEETIVIVPPLDNASTYTLSDYLRDEKDAPNNKRERKLLISYNTGLSNPLGKKIAENENNIPQDIRNHIKTIYPQAEVQKAFYYNQTAEKTKTSCGVLTVENLVTACYQVPLYHTTTLADIEGFRRQHLELMQGEGGDPGFSARQHDNHSTVADITQQLAYLNQDNTIKLMQAEQQRLENIKYALAQLRPAHQQILLTALQNPLSNTFDAHHQYLAGVRQAVALLFQDPQNKMTSVEQEAFNALCRGFFSTALENYSPLNELDFKITYEELQLLTTYLLTSPFHKFAQVKSSDSTNKIKEILINLQVATASTHGANSISFKMLGSQENSIELLNSLLPKLPEKTSIQSASATGDNSISIVVPDTITPEQLNILLSKLKPIAQNPDQLLHQLENLFKKIDEFTKLYLTWETKNKDLEEVNISDVWNVQIGSANFVGRIEKLKELFDSLRSRQYSLPHVISGFGGIGKTQLARQYTFFSKNYYSIVWWFDHEKSIDESYKELANAINKKMGENKIIIENILLEKIKANVIEFLRTYERGWLLVFDDIELEEKKFIEYLPQRYSHDNGHIIITSRFANWKRMKVIPLDILLRDESIELLRSIIKSEETNNQEEDNLKELAILLGDLPLALVQAAYCIKNGMSIEDYIQRLEDERNKGKYSLYEKNTPIDYYHGPVSIAWLISFEKIQGIDSQNILDFCAYLHHAKIPRKLLIALLNNDQDRYFNAIENLINFSFINLSIDKKYVSIHPVVQDIARNFFENKFEKNLNKKDKLNK